MPELKATNKKFWSTRSFVADYFVFLLFYLVKSVRYSFISRCETMFSLIKWLTLKRRLSLSMCLKNLFKSFKRISGFVLLFPFAFASRTRSVRLLERIFNFYFASLKQIIAGNDRLWRNEEPHRSPTTEQAPHPAECTSTVGPRPCKISSTSQARDEIPVVSVFHSRAPTFHSTNNRAARYRDTYTRAHRRPTTNIHWRARRSKLDRR